jgi:hypothetical protein
MTKNVEYRGYTISSTPSQLLGKDEWRPKIEISSEREGIVTAKSYTDDTTYAMEETANTHRIKSGQAITDGKVPVLSED